MKVTIDLNFEQLKELIKRLPASQVTELKAELSDAYIKQKAKKDVNKLRYFLLQGPVMSNEQFDAFQKNRTEFNVWRKNKSNFCD